MPEDVKRGRGKNEEKLVIKDPLMEPYEIRVDSTNHVVIDASKSSANAQQGYYHDLSGAIKCIIKLKLRNQPETFTLRQYLDEFSKLLDRLDEIVKPFK